MALFFNSWKCGLLICPLFIPLMADKGIWRVNGMMIDKRKQTYAERNLFQCHSVQHKSEMDYKEILPKTSRYKAIDYADDLQHGLEMPCFNIELVCSLLARWPPSGPWPPPHSRGFLWFLDHKQRHTTVGRTPLDEWWVRRRDLYLTTHNTHNRLTSCPWWDSNPRFKQASGRRPTS